MLRGFYASASVCLRLHLSVSTCPTVALRLVRARKLSRSA